MTDPDGYPTPEEAFADADAKIELAHALQARARPIVEGDAGWRYLVEQRHLPEAAVRAALGELRLIEPLIEGRAASDYAVVSLLRHVFAGAVTGLQLTFIDVTGAPSGRAPKRQSYALVEHGARNGLFWFLRDRKRMGEFAYICEGRLEKPIALVAAGFNSVYGAGGRSIIGFSVPLEPWVVIVTDRRPDGKVVDIKTGRSAADDHDRDYKRAVDRLLLAGKKVSITPDPPCDCCKDADEVLIAHGEAAVANWVAMAKPVDVLSLDGEAHRIAAIADDLEREAETNATAKRLKVRVDVLRKRIAQLRGGEGDGPSEASASGAPVTTDLEPAAVPQNGAQLLDDVDQAFRHHTLLSEADRTKLILWTIHGHRRFHKNITVLPRVIISAPGEESGKSTVGEVLSNLGDRMAYSLDPSQASVFRSIETDQAGWIFDEVDSWYHHLDDMRRIINAGFDERAKVHRVEDVGRGDKRQLETRAFSVFAPIVLIGIRLDKILRRTTLSRALSIFVRPARPHEAKGLAPVDEDRAAVAQLRTLAGRIKRWVADNESALGAAKPELPPGLYNRLRQVWRPLLMIADLAGGKWPARVSAALAADRGRTAEMGLGEQLLLDVRDIIKASGKPALHSKDIIEQLLGIEERVWAMFGKAQLAIRDVDVAKLLGPYEVQPDQIKIAGLNRRGYKLADVEAAIERYLLYLAPGGPKSRYPATDVSEPKDPACYNGSGDIRYLDATSSGPLPENTASDGISDEVAATSKPDATAFSEIDQCGSGVAGLQPTPTQGEASDISNGRDSLVEDPTGGWGFTLTADWQDVPDGAVFPPGCEYKLDIATGRQRVRLPAARCVDCGAEVPKPARGPTPKRCLACRAKRRQRVEQDVVFEG